MVGVRGGSLGLENVDPSLFAGVLEPDERLIWTGRPRRRWITQTEYFSVAFSCCALTIGTLGLLMSVTGGYGSSGPGFLVSIFFVVVGLLVAAVNIGSARRRRVRSIYALSDRRVLWIVTGRDSIIRSVPFASSVILVDRSRRRTEGTVRFGDPRAAHRRGFTRLRWYVWEDENMTPVAAQAGILKTVPHIAFYDVSPVEPLFGAINFLRSQASADSVRSKWCMTSSRLSVLKDVANTRPEAKRVELANPPEGLSGPQGF